ncbi:MAG: hypothetical protein KDI36_07915 [Pseudomonadales bacterium]|nr:hypothetical protein [Pseudomonadales bacterium]
MALSPYTFKGQHAAVTGLPDIWVDAVHRIVTDQTRITGDYIAANAGSGLSKAEYAELVGVVVAVISVDEFNRAIGVAAETLPEPVTGEPTRYTPECLVEDTGYLPMIARDRTGEREQDLWRPGRTANVLRALSSVPNAVRDWLALAEAQYLSIARMAHFGEFDDRSINRMQMELVAGRVSAWNQCFY